MAKEMFPKSVWGTCRKTNRKKHPATPATTARTHAMRQPKHYRARGISIPPDLEAQVAKRAAQLDLTFSRYVVRALRRALANRTAGAEQLKEAL